MNFCISIYIPRMSIGINENTVKEEFKKYIGEVVRVDFTPIDKKPGFQENYNNIFKSAFIHFKSFYNNQIANDLLLMFKNNNSYKFYTQLNEYWILLKAKNPIPTTWMNNSQIVENSRYLENKLEIQEEQIKILHEKLEKLEKLFETEKEKNVFILNNEEKKLHYFDMWSNTNNLFNNNDFNTISSNSSLEELEELDENKN